MTDININKDKQNHFSTKICDEKSLMRQDYKRKNRRQTRLNKRKDFLAIGPIMEISCVQPESSSLLGKKWKRHNCDQGI